MICRTNQLTGFYIMATLAFNKLIFNSKKISSCVLQFEAKNTALPVAGLELDTTGTRVDNSNHSQKQV